MHSIKVCGPMYDKFTHWKNKLHYKKCQNAAVIWSIKSMFTTKSLADHPQVSGEYKWLHFYKVLIR